MKAWYSELSEDPKPAPPKTAVPEPEVAEPVAAVPAPAVAAAALPESAWRYPLNSCWPRAVVAAGKHGGNEGRHR